MKKNIGSLDRTIRLVLGVVIIVLGLVYGCWLGLIGVLLVVTALVRTCPVYLPFKISTICKKK